jgi:type I restriction enzyme, S subunit
MQLNKQDWQTVTFGDVVFQGKGAIDPKSSGVKRYIAGEHMVTEDLHLRQWGTVGEDYLGPAFHRPFEKGDILYGSRRTYLKKVAVADFDGVTSNTTFVIKEKSDLVVPGFVAFLMLSERFTEHSVKNSKGSVNPYINFKDITKFEFRLPPYDEQLRLAEILWAADEVGEKYRTLLTQVTIAQTRYAIDFHQDVTQEMGFFSDLVALNPRVPKDLKDPKLLVTFLAMADVSEAGKILTKHERHLNQVRKGFTYFADGDVLFAKITPCMENGKGALADGLTNGVGFGSTEFHVLRPVNTEDALYCYFVSRMDYFRDEAEKTMVGSAGQRRVPTSFFENFALQIPTPEARVKFGEVMNAYEKQKENLLSSIQQIQAVKQQFVNQIFSI